MYVTGEVCRGVDYSHGREYSGGDGTNRGYMVGGPDPSLRGDSIRRPSPPTESVSVCASATSASAEAVAAEDVEDDVDDGHDDLHGESDVDLPSSRRMYAPLQSQR